jgi:hypothetical protein
LTIKYQAGNSGFRLEKRERLAQEATLLCGYGWRRTGVPAGNFSF